MLSVKGANRIVKSDAADRFVLLVDDHEPSLTNLRQVLETAGFECVSTPSAPDALVHCDTCLPAVVITDLSMPRLDGQGLARWLKARYPSLPIVLLTGERIDAQTEATLRETFSAILPKPLDVESLLSLLGELMLMS